MNPQSPVVTASNHDHKRTQPFLVAAILITNIRAMANTITAVNVADSPLVNHNTYTMRSGIAATAV
ncbi:hypothetical protein BELL_0128g00130 [Botrytis elliptica]|uniref:Uncharacterized protein n=1 Tax=Botrytis elliptica TaxID=278938 RepID=A0A4Z1JU91_9HELO|nr:hypothetical protein BELL_0128g00130 [Botrytis elliptica]